LGEKKKKKPHGLQREEHLTAWKPAQKKQTKHKVNHVPSKKNG